MRLTRRSLLLLRAQNLLSVLLLLVALALAAWLSTRYTWQWDWTVNQRNTLSVASEKLLRALPEPLTVTAFARETGGLRERIRGFIARYQRVKADLTLGFVNPDTAPEQVRKLGVEKDGELIVTYRGRTERVTRLDEQTVANTLQRLANREQAWVVFLEGHEERSPSEGESHDLGQFASELKTKGYVPQGLNLTAAPVIADNTRLLVLASPRTDPLPGELERIGDYLDGGGQLLWLQDPNDADGWKPLADRLGIARLPGVVVDAGTRALGLDDPRFALVPRYTDHPISQGLRAVTLFPSAAALAVSPPQGWQARELLATLERSWTETGPMAGEIRQDAELGERAGPLMIGLSLERVIGERQQRIVVIGDGDWLSDRYLGNGGNLDLALRIVRWLARDDALIAVPARTAPDRTLELGTNALAVLGSVALFGLPALTASIGLFTWLRRRNG